MPAFRGAEGNGENTTGGRGGIIVKVTTLGDNGNNINPIAGSFREAIKSYGSTARIIVFDVGGTIELQSTLPIGEANSNFTILGQTAPGDGITIAHRKVNFDGCNNFIVRYLRFRMGVFAGQGLSGDALDCKYGNDFIIDHCSISWGTDETGSFSFMNRGTIQWTIISEALNFTIYSQERPGRGYGSLAGGKDQTFYMCLFANNRYRNPRGVALDALREGKVQADYFGGHHNIINCVMFNFGQNISGYAQSNVNVINNYVRRHIANEVSNSYQLSSFVQSGFYNSEYGQFYLSGNVHEGYPDVTSDNSLGIQTSPATAKENLLVGTPFPSPINRLYAANQALDLVLQYVGKADVRDSVDIRVIQETNTKQIFRSVFQAGEIQSGDQTGSGDGTNPEVSRNGIIDHQDDVGGFPVLANGTPSTNTSGDGIPDSWKTENGLNINTNYEGVLSPSGYDWVEEYSMELVFSISEYYENPITTTYTLTLTTTAGGTATRNPASGTIEQNATVILTATPATGFNFSRWQNVLTGQVLSQNATYNHVMLDDISIVAVFVSDVVDPGDAIRFCRIDEPIV